MSGDDGFLARWSRRKQSAAGGRRASATVQAPVAADAIASDTAKTSVAPEASAAIADPASLPPIESLDAASDITPFLAQGVPAELTRQALRQAWTADPAIRDFVGLSENAWDFNAPGGVPGFGPLTPEDIGRLLDAVTGTQEAVEPSSDAAGPTGAQPPPAPAAAPAAATAAETPVVVTQAEPDERKPRAPVSGRRHGGALPR